MIAPALPLKLVTPVLVIETAPVALVLALSPLLVVKAVTPVLATVTVDPAPASVKLIPVPAVNTRSFDNVPSVAKVMYCAVAEGTSPVAILAYVLPSCDNSHCGLLYLIPALALGDKSA